MLNDKDPHEQLYLCQQNLAGVLSLLGNASGPLDITGDHLWGILKPIEDKLTETIILLEKSEVKHENH